MRNFLKIAMVLSLLVAMGAATQRPLMGDLEALTTDVTTDYTGIGVPIAAMNGLQTDIDSLESGIMPSMAAESAPASFVTATYTTELVGANNDIVWTAVAGSSWGGTLGNSIDIIYTNPGEDTGACSVSANTSTGDVDVTLSYGTGAINATAQDVMDAVAADATASLMIVGTNYSTDDGSGTVTALTTQDLSGGVNGTAGTVGQLYYYSGDLFYLVSGTTFYDATWAQWDGADTDGTPTSTRSFTTSATVTAEQVTSTDDASVADNLTVGDTVTADDATITNNTAIGGTCDVDGDSTFDKVTIDEGVFTPITTVNASTYDILATDYMIGVTYSQYGTCALDFKTAQIADGRTIHIVDTGGNASGYTITVSTEGDETINGAATATIESDYGSLSIICDGTNLVTF